MNTERKMPLLEGAMKTLVREKVSELKAFKMELKMEEVPQTDEQKAKENISDIFRLQEKYMKEDI